MNEGLTHAGRRLFFLCAAVFFVVITALVVVQHPRITELQGLEWSYEEGTHRRVTVIGERSA